MRLEGGATCEARLNGILSGVATWLASFIASWLGLGLLQSKQDPQVWNPASCARPTGRTRHRIESAGRTLDLTLVAATQAVDIVVGELGSRYTSRPRASQTRSKVEQLISRITNPLCFATCSGLIMWAWVYAPCSLPRSYNKWIASAARVDVRLIEALRRCRKGELRYAEDNGKASLLGSMCKEYGLPFQWSDPAKSIPFSCDIVHMGMGSSCEFHARCQFWLSWKLSMCTHLPLALALLLRNPGIKSLRTAVLSVSRSSAFLATFIALFYYGVCLGRMRLGPYVLGKNIASRNRINGGLCIGLTCILCGWSVLVEAPSHRRDMTLFVAPRAMATLLPRRYTADKQWFETLVFAASTAVIFTCVLEKPKRVRGMMGGILSLVMRP